MHRLFLKSQTRRVLSSAQLKINFPPEWNRTPRTQLSWPTLCTRREQWAGWELSIPHLTRWQTEGPCLALQGQLLKPLRAHSLSTVSIITHTPISSPDNASSCTWRQTNSSPHVICTSSALQPQHHHPVQPESELGTAAYGPQEVPQVPTMWYFTENKIQSVTSISVNKPSYSSQNLHHSMILEIVSIS